MNLPAPRPSDEHMSSIADKICDEHSIELSKIVIQGKLPKELMDIRKKIIREIHKTGQYQRMDIARFFGLSFYTITAALDGNVSRKMVPFTKEEDAIINDMHLKGHSVEEIKTKLTRSRSRKVRDIRRSVFAIRRRIETLTNGEPSSRPFPKPSYKSEVAPPSWVDLARIENARMRKNL